MDACIVAKKRDPGILDPGPFSAKIRKVEARLRKLAEKLGNLSHIRKMFPKSDKFIYRQIRKIRKSLEN